MADTPYAETAGSDGAVASPAGMSSLSPAADDCDTSSCFFCISPETD